ncbi:MAG: hypothetical protein OXE85_08915 [Roseovarius sp.]|nr:hypothetical protein [Roseovarius sp.]
MRTGRGLLKDAAELAVRIAENPPHVLRMAKSARREAEALGRESLPEMSAACRAVVQRTGDRKEAIRAMTEKDKPRFAGEF